jgi:hypothetical protein
VCYEPTRAQRFTIAITSQRVQAHCVELLGGPLRQRVATGPLFLFVLAARELLAALPCQRAMSISRMSLAGDAAAKLLGEDEAIFQHLNHLFVGSASP